MQRYTIQETSTNTTARAELC